MEVWIFLHFLRSLELLCFYNFIPCQFPLHYRCDIHKLFQQPRWYCSLICSFRVDCLVHWTMMNIWLIFYVFILLSRRRFVFWGIRAFNIWYQLDNGNLNTFVNILGIILNIILFSSTRILTFFRSVSLL